MEISTKSTKQQAVNVDDTTGLTWTQKFCPTGTDVWETTTWEKRDASIGDATGNMVFEQTGIDVPSSWSVTATNVVVSKYFRGHVGTDERETSIRQLIHRVTDTIATWGLKDGYFDSVESADAFRADLTWLCLHQHMAFNSPVWFNVGVEERPQCSACFINSVEDSMESILGLAKTEGMLFKWGSGAGTNLSPIRSSKELLRGGGEASGPVSFMRGFDAFAGVIKSGGKTRRAAKMVILDVDHPDIVEFVNCKVEEEKKAWALIDAGYDGGFNVPGGAYDSVFFQNSNNSVRVSDAYMKAVEDGTEWQTRAVTDGSVVDTIDARELMNQIAQAAWDCGDPGLQFDTTVNDWHPCINTDRIYASNPCSEYMFLDNSACNLASLNLMKFRNDDGTFDTDRFRAAVRTAITAQEIIVDRASYQTPMIEQNSLDYRPLGLGFANLGALLMAKGLPYDSDEGRNYAGTITALMHGEAYSQSARIAELRGPFAGYHRNQKPMLRVIGKHRKAARAIAKNGVPKAMLATAKKVWDECYALGQKHGYRNGQVTVLAPTGTIGFMMDCDTTGVEPDIALIKYKKLVGGGMLKIVNQTVPLALAELGYTPTEQAAIGAFLETHETIEGAPFLKEEHLAIFDCAFKPRNGVRTIEPMGHVKMMGACQPFLSGAISKTVNMPKDSTVQDIADVYMESWRLGLKAVAVYRDGCKRTQPLNTSLDTEETEAVEATKVEYKPVRRKLPVERAAVTHKFSVAGHEGYITVGQYEDGSPGEIFLVMAKEGSVVSGLMDAFATSVSLALQYGVPLDALSNKFMHMRFEPAGFTGNPEIPIAKSIMDYIFRWMDLRFGEKAELTTNENEAMVEPTAAATTTMDDDSVSREETVFTTQADAPPCTVCGTIMVRSGACYKCFNCGATSGCS
ncbi:MAG: vitamin B12-dependent ribonucleotide reductase [Myxococcota bacterium]|nr:vitamin B12-dependent ribonucleotide reductase [Myxococcota bacterium]